VRRDVTHLAALFADPANATGAPPATGVMMELDNTVDTTNTSPFWARAWVDFYVDPAAPADGGAAPPDGSAAAAAPRAVVGLTNLAESWGRWFMLQPTYT
jgi:hypothetical protein